MPRRGPAYGITADWQQWVRDRIEELKEAGTVRSQNEVAKLAGISPASLSEALKEGAVQTTVMPQIHKALKWPAPLLCPPLHVLSLVERFCALTDRQQGEWLERIRSEVERARRR